MSNNLKMKKYIYCILPVLLMLSNLIIKGLYITNDALAHDEPFSVFNSQFDIINIIKELSKGNNPPLYELFLHFWTTFFGISELSVRFPSLIFSTITVFFIYQIGKRNFNLKIAVVASLLFIFSNYQIIYAHQARVYALFAMLVAISMYYFLELIRNHFTIQYFIALLIANLAMIYSHYFGFFVLFIQFTFILFNNNLRKKYWKILIIFILIITFFYIPNLQILYNRFSESATNGTWISPPRGIGDIFNIIKSFSNAPVVAIIAFIIIIIALFKYFFKERPIKIFLPTAYIFISFFFPVLFIFFISYKIPMFIDRYLIFVSIPYYFIIAISAHYIFKEKRLKYSVFLLIVLLFIVTIKPKISNNTNMREVLKIVKSLKTKKSVIYLCPAWFDLTFSYHYNLNSFTNANKEYLNNYLSKENIYPIYGASELKEDINNNSDKIIYLDAGADFGLPNNGILQNLNSHYKLIKLYKVDEVFKIYEYTSK